ncbi:hypothetical protein ACM46_12680 [Chryseobacterium angstadtii]|uniref:Uncharacterized protein n=1 Tax=Chryseobacterium angstadtii TaxID=558151 RepID=A0A0J7IGB4_9FLAO|nr:hypothetical protein [Chryseobacterium angstadtii]KMQ65044.1 hypothetical protein ACM46_12680 [Chryseobacterium angstadtii]
MKKIITLYLLTISFFLSAQIAIGKQTVASPSASIDFGAEDRGIILPWISSVSALASAVNGSIVFDLTDHKVKVKYNAGWKDLTVGTTGTTVDPMTGLDGVTVQYNEPEASTGRTSIGNHTNTPGILVLEDTDKAMVLPKVAHPHLNIINPSAGMIVYDTASKLLAVFNGKLWSFWKP